MKLGSIFKSLFILFGVISGLQSTINAATCVARAVLSPLLYVSHGAATTNFLKFIVQHMGRLDSDFFPSLFKTTSIFFCIYIFYCVLSVKALMPRFY